MIKLTEILAAKEFHERGMPPGAKGRWAFLVTFEEIDSLVTEAQTNKELGLEMDQRLATDIIQGRAMWNINGMPILPELMDPNTQPKDH